ncbi:hypothetical protein CIL03_17260 [Virgibacillus indicus]|uniref:DUF4363 domain-containing protein n=1 Tax=Virgibacillus indicus TaxID=2024554 RepID=A0A265N5M8_9BACI|nr:DUF4363 family protein [Virgibacillus indicus]OZU87338.1 hypothetical protein CIL03_17260 [Virgibacillus indicus]
MKFTKLGLLCICLMLLISCSNETIQNKHISQKAEAIKTLITQSQWDKAVIQGRQFEQVYADNKWKYQLLGDITEYDRLDQHIRKLNVALEEKDKEEAKLNLTMIEHYIESLYFK